MMLRLALLAAAAFAPTAAAVAGPGSEALAVRVGVRRTPASLRELERLFWAVATPGAPEYQQYLSPEQLRELTTAASADTTLVVAWLREAGCDDPVLAETGDAVTSARCPAPTPVAPRRAGRGGRVRPRDDMRDAALSPNHTTAGYLVN
jgi:hypothetical protein